LKLKNLNGEDLVYSIVDRASSSANKLAGEETEKGTSWLSYILGAICFGLIMYFMSMLR
jgi:hypothetical protein